jgi:hypothetical protein
MKKVLAISLLVALLLAIPATVLAGGTALERTMRAGWSCADISGAMHCFDPGDGRSKNTASINVKVFDYDGSFLGTEQLWRSDLYAGQPCPQDKLIDLGAYIACHRYSH